MISRLNDAQDAKLVSLFSTGAYHHAWEPFVRRYSPLIWQSIHKTFRAVSFYYEHEEVEDTFKKIMTSLLDHEFNQINKFQCTNAGTLATWLVVFSSNHAIDCVRNEGILSLRNVAHPSDHSAYMQQPDSNVSFFTIAAYLDGRLAGGEKATIDQYLAEHPERRSTLAVIRRVLFDRNLEHAGADIPAYMIDRTLQRVPAEKLVA